MKFAIVALFLFAFTTCATFPDLEASIDKDKIIQCIQSAEPIFEDIIILIEAFQTKKIWENLVPIATSIVDHVKEAVDKCKIKSNEIALEGGFWKKVKKAIKKAVKVVVTVAKIVVYIADQVNQMKTA